MNFNKLDLQNITYIGQFDHKFLIYQSNNIINCRLYIIDQHGAHERIQLESLLDNYVYNLDNTNLSTINIKKDNLISIDIVNQHYCKEINQIIKEMEYAKITIRVKSINSSRIVFVIESAPLCIFKDALFNEYLNTESVNNFIKALIIRCLNSTSPVKSVEMLKLIRDFACHSSIKFNYKIKPEEAELIIKKLALCRFPFFCAHGRSIIFCKNI